MAYAYYRAFFNELVPPASAVNYELVLARIYRKIDPANDIYIGAEYMYENTTDPKGNTRSEI